jgi:hypothetical protein
VKRIGEDDEGKDQIPTAQTPRKDQVPRFKGSKGMPMVRPLRFGNGFFLEP